MLCVQQDLVHLTGFTDGSVDFKLPSRDGQVIMGIGWIIPEAELSFKVATILWPSSTKAELSAILSLLLVLPVKIQSIVIHTDSQAAIDNISRYQALSLRAISKIPNSMLIEQIWKVANTKQITLTMRKVKGHLGDHYNEVADLLAKEAATQGLVDPASIFRWSTILHSQQPFTLIWKDRTWEGVWRKTF